MNTRFDQEKFWFTQVGKTPLREMDTQHLYNSYVMFAKYPDRVLSVLLWDFDHLNRYNNAAGMRPWSAEQRAEDSPLYLSVRAATSMTTEELVSYAYSTPLMRAVANELKARGVNEEQVKENFNIEEEIN